MIQHALLILTPLLSDPVQLVGDSYKIQDETGTYSVIDLYVDLPGLGNAAFSIYGVNASVSDDSSWFHSDPQGSCPDGGTWIPSAFVVQNADSWVTVGATVGTQNFTGLDPNFDNSPACSPTLGDNAGWFNANPPSLQGIAKNYVLHNGEILNSAVLIGRFVIEGIRPSPVSLQIDSLSVNWGTILTPFYTANLKGSFQYPLAADIDGDGLVNGSDLGILLGSWGVCPDSPECAADLNGDSVIDGSDLGLLLGSWTL